MASRGRPRKPPNTRMDGAIDAMIPFGFSEDVVRRTVKDLLKEYGGDEGWAFIEGDAYNVLIETILDEQEKREQEERKQEKCGEKENFLKDDSSQDGRAGDNAIAAAAGPSGASAPTFSEVVDTASQTVETGFHRKPHPCASDTIPNYRLYH